MKMYLLIAAGSALGGVSRHWLSTMTAAKTPFGIPWGTLAINVIGSFLIGIVATLPESRLPGGLLTRQFLTIGFLGGFTTFSAFSMQSFNLLQSGRIGSAGVYVILSVVLCIGGAALGAWMINGPFSSGK